MREAVRQSINGGSRQTNSEKTACDIRIIHDALDLLQTAPWNFGIDVDEPENVAARGPRTSVHLFRSTRLAYDKLIAKALREIAGAVGASAIDDDHFSATRSLAQVS
jgi:hypothetical protein